MYVFDHSLQTIRWDRCEQQLTHEPLLFQKTTPREFKSRISRTKGHLSKRTAFVREIVKEVSGYVQAPTELRGGWGSDRGLPGYHSGNEGWKILAPYERRVIELLRNSKDKRARKLAKKRVRVTLLLLDALKYTPLGNG
ncbi:MAG: hypothetical protein Q9173_004598 [Seirophora scorigena]